MAYTTDSPQTQQQDTTPWYVKVGRSLVSIVFGGVNPRAGGADPCCPPGYNPAEPWPVNSGVDGAPPDYRTKGAPFLDKSPSGTGRKKDDLCDCVPFSFNGRYYMVGGITSTGVVTVGIPEDRDNAVWVQVDPMTLRAIAVPGVGHIGGTTPGTPPDQPYPVNVTTSGLTGKIGLIAALGLGLAVARQRRWI